MTHRERLERKRDRRLAWAEKRETKADAAHARVHEIADQIPFGQPILVGHHSEGHARRDQERMEKGMRASIDNSRAAADHQSKADGLDRQLRTSVFSDDEDAIERLTEIVAKLEAERDRIKAYNASCRRGSPDATLLDEKQQADLKSTAAHSAYLLGENGAFPAYHLSNLGATIRQKKEHIKQITGRREMEAAGTRDRGRMMLSRYVGTCADCGGGIERGAPIIWHRSTREAVHATCPEVAA